MLNLSTGIMIGDSFDCVIENVRNTDSVNLITSKTESFGPPEWDNIEENHHLITEEVKNE